MMLPDRCLIVALIGLALTVPLHSAESDITLTDLHIRPEAWQLEPGASWRFEPANDEQPARMSIVKVGKPRNKPVRRPSTYAIVKDRSWQAATLDMQVRSMEPATTKGRDLCIILGYVDDTHYTYIHLSNDADGKAHNVIMKVEGESRRVIHQPAKPEARLTQDGWQAVRVRFDNAGRIEVFHDETRAAPVWKSRSPGTGARSRPWRRRKTTPLRLG